MGYDAVGNTRSLTDPVGNTTTWSYDALDRITTRTDPTNTSATFAYDAAGQLRSTTDRLGRRVDYGYDGVGRLAAEVWLTSGATVQVQTWTYDAAGRMLTAQDPDGVYTLGYDTADRVTSVHEPYGAALTFGYDGVGNRTGVQDSGGGVTTVSFDALGRQTAEEFGGSGLTKVKEGRTYTAAGEVSLVTRQAWVSSAWSTAGTTSLAYDAAGQVTKVTHIKSGSAVASYVYSYDAAGRLSSEVLNGTSRTYSYDATGQLTADAGTAYGYDANGNRNTSGYATGAANRMTTDGTWTYTYDAEGNVTKRSKGASSDTWVYTYDHRNQLVGAAYSATDGGAVTQRVTNSYDAWGNKVQRQAWDGSTTTTERYAVDGWDPAKDWAIGVENFDTWADLNGSNAITLRRGYGPGFDELSWRQTSGGTAGWYLTDSLGSVRGVTNSTGTPLTTLTYSGWGAVLSNSTPAQSDAYQFTGRPVDPATGLRNHRERDTPGNQWLQEDPSGLAPDVNNRRYVGNSPTNFTDPSGRSIINFTGTDTAGGSVTGPAGNLPTTGGPSGQDVFAQATGVKPPVLEPGVGLGLGSELDHSDLTDPLGDKPYLLDPLNLIIMSLPPIQLAPPAEPPWPTFTPQQLAALNADAEKFLLRMSGSRPPFRPLARPNDYLNPAKFALTLILAPDLAFTPGGYLGGVSMSGELPEGYTPSGTSVELPGLIFLGWRPSVPMRSGRPVVKLDKGLQDYLSKPPRSLDDVMRVRPDPNAPKLPTPAGPVKPQVTVARKDIKEFPDAYKMADKFGKAQQDAYEQLKNDLSLGLPGRNQHALTGDRNGQFAADLPGSGKGRGKLRVIYEINDDEIRILEIVDYH